MSGSYTERTWLDGSAGGTAFTADAMNNIEDGVTGAHNRIDTLVSGITVTPTAVQTTAVAPSPGQLVAYNAGSGAIGPIGLPLPTGGALIVVVKSDATTNPVTFTSSVLQGNGGSNTITLRATGESRTLYGTASNWYLTGTQSPTIGTTAGTVAAGNDSRFANSLAASVYGGALRTQAPVCEAYFTGAAYGVTASDLYAGGGWSTAAPGVDTDTMLTTSAGFQAIQIPVTGRYRIHLSESTWTSAACLAVARITLNAAFYTSSVAVGTSSSPISGELHLDATRELPLAAGNLLFWSNWCSAGVLTITPVLNGAKSSMSVRYVGPI